MTVHSYLSEQLITVMYVKALDILAGRLFYTGSGKTGGTGGLRRDTRDKALSVCATGELVSTLS